MDIRFLTEIYNRPQKVKQTYKKQNRFLQFQQLVYQKTCLVLLRRAERVKEVNTFWKINTVEPTPATIIIVLQQHVKAPNFCYKDKLLSVKPILSDHLAATKWMPAILWQQNGCLQEVHCILQHYLPSKLLKDSNSSIRADVLSCSWYLVATCTQI